MSAGQSDKSTSLDQVYAEAYRSYLRSLKEGLANVDIDALDLSSVRAPLHPAAALFTIHPAAALFTIAGSASGSPSGGAVDPTAGAAGTTGDRTP